MSLWILSQVKEFTHSPQAYMKKYKSQIKETSFCTCQKASLTVEAAVVMPLMASLFVTILFFFRIIQVQAVVEEALLYAGRKTAVESSVVKEEIILYASAKAFLLYALKDEPVVEQYVEQGSLGVILLGSDFGDENIVLRAHYQVKLPVSLFGIDSVWLWNRSSFRKWGGGSSEEEENSGEYVYVTQTGEVYHKTNSCQAIRISVKKAKVGEIDDLRGLNGQKYYSCSRCAEENTGLSTVYYTDYGTLYHGSLNCSYIKRTVEKVLLSEVGERRPCSYCY